MTTLSAKSIRSRIAQRVARRESRGVVSASAWSPLLRPATTSSPARRFLNAGCGTFEDHTEADLDRVLDINLRAPIHLTRIVLPHLRQSTGAHIVLVSSMAGGLAFPFQSAYSTSKFGLRGFGAALRIELAGDGIGVTTVMPGTIATQFLANATTHDEGTSTRLSGLMQRIGTRPERVAQVALRAVRRNRGTVRAGWDSRTVGFVSWMAPPLMPALLRLSFRRPMLGPTHDPGPGDRV